MRERVGIALAFAALAGGVSVAIVLLTRESDSGPTRGDYLAEVNRVCREYERRLEQIPPPATFANPQVVAQSFGQALPIVEQRVAAIRAIEPPEAMSPQVRLMLAAAEAGTAAMRRVLTAARAGDVARMGDALATFLAAREAARRQSQALGITC